MLRLSLFARVNSCFTLNHIFYSKLNCVFAIAIAFLCSFYTRPIFIIINHLIAILFISAVNKIFGLHMLLTVKCNLPMLSIFIESAFRCDICYDNVR